MSAIMDMYLTASDSMSFQDILDIDIKSEIDCLVGAMNDCTEQNFSEILPLEFDCPDIKWFSSTSNHSSSSLNFDFSNEERHAMVNPHAIMPALSLAQNLRSPSPTVKESHLAFSPSMLKLQSLKQQQSAHRVKKDLFTGRNENEEIKIRQAAPTTVTATPIIKTVTKVTPIGITKQQLKTLTTHAKTTPTLLTFRNTINRQIGTPITITHLNNVTTLKTTPTQTITTQATLSNNRNKVNHNNNNNNRFYGDDGERIYPKPAYSYSCLIAMALKNSRSGSLPVSEIYNFMCKHFPYFITAPNGWKNSVRHNLSLNKCFEKIEKPITNGSHRKGCLWAMNPAKISKMDEEVQKWSRKDPTAIRKAMVHPENLEFLERGELKFSCSYDEDTFGDSCGSAESEEGSDYEQETEFVNVQTIIKPEVEDASDLDIEVNSDVEGEVYEDLEEDQQMLRMEVALAQKELMEYERTVNNKRRKTYILQ